MVPSLAQLVRDMGMCVRVSLSPHSTKKRGWIDLLSEAGHIIYFVFIDLPLEDESEPCS